MLSRNLFGPLFGVPFAAIAALGSFARRARFLHPDGVVYRADVTPLGDDPLAKALEGSALVRLSGATHRWPAGVARHDILGVAVRFHPSEEREQDLLFASFLRTVGLPLAFFTTDTNDFFANAYGSAFPSRAPGHRGRVDFRLVTDAAARQGRGTNRLERLMDNARAGNAVFTLQIRRRGLLGQPVDLARITLREHLHDGGVHNGGENLRFNPFNAGLGIKPVGFLQGVRKVVYPASQLGRALARMIPVKA